MKSVGLLQLMLQAGMLIPVDETSEFGIFEKIFADIGDQQSLEDDLSTYSSRLANARSFLEKSDEKTLILIDEFGSGTDPKIGGARFGSSRIRECLGIGTSSHKEDSSGPIGSRGVSSLGRVLCSN